MMPRDVDKLFFFLLKGEYILQSCTREGNNEDLSTLLLDDALQFVIDSDLVVSIFVKVIIFVNL